MTGVTSCVTNALSRAGIGTFRSVGSGSPSNGQVDEAPGKRLAKATRSVEEGAAKATYLNGRGERSHTDPGDLNVPLRLECVLTGRGRWLEDAG